MVVLLVERVFLSTPAGSEYWKNTVSCFSSRKQAEATNLLQQPPCSADSEQQNRSHYLVYPHGNLTVCHVTYIFSTDSGLWQALEKTARQRDGGESDICMMGSR